ncbi:MAG: DUF5063 domain-containing protein [Pseudomonadota bacterium]|nr:DUF5063 domain-containing protein [Pseudomonadota bacterium]
MSSDAGEIVNLAQRYCEVIETCSEERSQWLREIADVLPRLHAAITSLDGRAYEEHVPFGADLDARFALYGRLRDLLGDRDGYWLEFDRMGDTNAMTGSLADDLTDIYCELKQGLRLVDEHPDRAVQGWLSGFEFHWGRHLTDAERHMATLASLDRLG